MGSAIDALVGVGSRTEFRAHWADQVFCSHGSVSRLPGFLNATELQSLASLTLAYQGQIAVTRGEKTSAMVAADPQGALDLFRMGLTVYFDNIAPTIAGADTFLRQLEGELGVNAGAARLSAWASPAGGGVGCHYDCGEVISIQLRGKKRYELAPVSELQAPYGRSYTPEASIHEEQYPQATRGFPEWKDARFEAIELGPGSILSFPRGTWHRTHVTEDSFAVAIVIEPPAALDCLLKQVRLLLLQDARWRKPLYGAWGDDQDRMGAYRQAERLLQELPDAVRQLAPSDLVLHTLTESERLARIDRRSRFLRNRQTGLRLDSPGPPSNPQTQWVQVVRDDAQGQHQALACVELPRPYVRVLEWMARQRSPFDFFSLSARFPKTPGDELKHLLELCVRSELLRLLPFSALPDKAPQRERHTPV